MVEILLLKDEALYNIHLKQDQCPKLIRNMVFNVIYLGKQPEIISDMRKRASTRAVLAEIISSNCGNFTRNTAMLYSIKRN